LISPPSITQFAPVTFASRGYASYPFESLESADVARSGDDRGALRGKRPHDGKADALAGTGDDRNLVAQVQIHNLRVRAGPIPRGGRMTEPEVDGALRSRRAADDTGDNGQDHDLGSGR
jgi:hypothetical protein